MVSDDELDLVSPPKEKVPRGRPRKTDTDEEVSLTDYTYLPPTRSNSLARTSSNVKELSVRTSNLNRFYDTYLGPALDNFPARTLPLKRTILQRYRFLRSKCHNAKQTYVTETITNELLHLWDCSAIPYLSRIFKNREATRVPLNGRKTGRKIV